MDVSIGIYIKVLVNFVMLMLHSVNKTVAKTYCTPIEYWDNLGDCQKCTPCKNGEEMTLLTPRSHQVDTVCYDCVECKEGTFSNDNFRNGMHIECVPWVNCNKLGRGFDIFPNSTTNSKCKECPVGFYSMVPWVLDVYCLPCTEETSEQEECQRGNLADDEQKSKDERNPDIHNADQETTETPTIVQTSDDDLKNILWAVIATLFVLLVILIVVGLYYKRLKNLAAQFSDTDSNEKHEEEETTSFIQSDSSYTSKSGNEFSLSDKEMEYCRKYILSMPNEFISLVFSRLRALYVPCLDVFYTNLLPNRIDILPEVKCLHPTDLQEQCRSFLEKWIQISGREANLLQLYEAIHNSFTDSHRDVHSKDVLSQLLRELTDRVQQTTKKSSSVQTLNEEAHGNSNEYH